MVDQVVPCRGGRISRPGGRPDTPPGSRICHHPSPTPPCCPGHDWRTTLSEGGQPSWVLIEDGSKNWHGSNALKTLVLCIPNWFSCSSSLMIKKLTFGEHLLATCEAWQSIPSRGPGEGHVGSTQYIEFPPSCRILPSDHTSAPLLRQHCQRWWRALGLGIGCS